jgi:hypothetical protein
MYEDKFTKIFESNFQRFQGGGILPGDVVKLIDSISSLEWLKGQPDNVKDKIDELRGSDQNIRVISVRGKIPASSGDIQQDNQAEDFYCDVAAEMAPGLFHDPITIPLQALEIVDTQGNLPPIPDSQRYDDNTHITPSEVSTELTEGEDETCPVFGTKSKEGDRELTDEDTPGLGDPGIDHMTTKVYMQNL